MDGNITKEGITADLEAMKQVGIGGAHIFDVGQGVPAGPIDYNTQEWRDLMVFALREAKRLDLDMTMHNCAGWSSSGGPWVKPEDAMKRTTSSSVVFSGPGKPTVTQPPTTRGYYKDISLIAFPAVDKPGTEHFNELVGHGANPGQVSKLNWPTLDPSRAIQIPLDRIGADGAIDFELPEGNWTVLRLGVTITGAQNVASRDSGRGLEVDKLSAKSLDNFLEGGLNPLLNQLGGDSALHTVLVDSYETGYNNWTPGILEEFQAARGYDPTPYLPALAGFKVNSDAATLGFLYDYRKTIAELWAKNYSGHFARRMKERNLQLAIEPYGNGNFDPFTFAKPAGLIMGEYWVGDSQINGSVKHASSVAHVYDHSVVGAEALTATPDQAGWRNQPRQWKPFADHAMTLGINRVIYHRFAHQPWVNDVLPGMTMGPWGSHVDRGNTIWPYMPAWNTYLTRCQAMLQSGKFVGDILLFNGEDSPQSYAGEGQNMPAIPNGYDFDYCGKDPLMSVVVKNGRLVLPNGASYAVLALPNSPVMSIGLARKVKQLVEMGATVIANRPTHTPSLSEVARGGNAEVTQIAGQVWGKALSAKGSNVFGKGKVHWGKTIAEVLAENKATPDFVTAAKEVRAIHRRVGRREMYFVASAQPYPQTAKCRFRVASPNVNVQLWHPENGRIEAAPVWKAAGANTIEVPLNFAADGSVFVMITPAKISPVHLTGVRALTTQAKAKPEPKLTILKAVYGDEKSGKTKDVTDRVKTAATPTNLRMRASNVELGGDPAINIVKTLVVTYQLGGQTHTLTLRENELLTVGNWPDSGTPPVVETVGGQLKIWQNGDYTTSWSNGKSSMLKVRDIPNAVNVDGAWALGLPKGWDAPEANSLERLQSWTESHDPGIKYFSGTGKYSKPLNVPANLLGAGKRVMLDLGDVREMCKIRINGKPVATMWKPPFRLDITDFIQAGNNRLEVDVTNLWVNRLIGDEQFPDDMGWNGAQLSKWPAWFLNGLTRPEPRRKTFTTWRHNFKDTPLLPSGLLGPVVLRSVKVVSVKP